MWTKGARIQHAPREERYPSDVTDAEWEIIAPMIPSQRQGGRLPSREGCCTSAMAEASRSTISRHLRKALSERYILVH